LQAHWLVGTELSSAPSAPQRSIGLFRLAEFASLAIAAAFALQVPTFQTSTRLGEINVIVHDKNSPSENLTQRDLPLARLMPSQRAGHKVYSGRLII